MLKNIFKVVLFLAASFGVERFCHKQTHGFRIAKIASDLPFDPARQIEPLADSEMQTVRALLSQPYTFLDSGGESYVFLSEDRGTILKFFKHHHMRPHKWIDPVLPQWELDRRKMRFERFFKSCKLAYDNFRKECGLIFIHLNKSDDLHIQLKIYDPNHIAHLIDLDQFEFALQKRVSMASATFRDLAKGGEMERAKERINSMLDLIARRCEAGLADHDAELRNFGFTDGEPFAIDLGAFSPDEEHDTKKTLIHDAQKLRKGIIRAYPELQSYLDEKIQELQNL